MYHSVRFLGAVFHPHFLFKHLSTWIVPSLLSLAKSPPPPPSGCCYYTVAANLFSNTRNMCVNAFVRLFAQYRPTFRRYQFEQHTKDHTKYLYIYGNITVILRSSLSRSPLVSLLCVLRLIAILCISLSWLEREREPNALLVYNCFWLPFFLAVHTFSKHIQQHHRNRVSSLHYSEIFFDKLFSCVQFVHSLTHTRTSLKSYSSHPILCTVRMHPHNT